MESDTPMASGLANLLKVAYTADARNVFSDGLLCQVDLAQAILLWTVNTG
jgi:hypothetical protein